MRMLRKILSKLHLRRVDWKKFGRRIKTFAWTHRAVGRRLAFAAGFSLVILLIHREVYSFIFRSEAYSVPEVRTAVVPEWAAGRGQEIVHVDGGSIMDPGLVERVGRAFEACPWVRKVESVERVFPDKLMVKFSYRRPHVAVRRPDGFVLVDDQGVRLPGVYVDPPQVGAPVIVSGLASHPPRPGTVWDNPALRAGLSMAGRIRGDELLQSLAVGEIDVSNFGGRLDPRRSEIALVTSKGCSLLWGRMASDARYGDLTWEEKIENLREVLAVYPNLNGLRCVKLYFSGSRAIERKDAHANGSR